MKKTLLIVVTLVIVPLFCLAQDEATTKEVELPAAGMLKSLISKDEQKKIVKLIIRGREMDFKDCQFIAKMPALKTLDISEISNLEQAYIPSVKILIDAARETDRNIENRLEDNIFIYRNGASNTSDLLSSLPNFVHELYQYRFHSRSHLSPYIETLYIKNIIRKKIPTGFPHKMYFGEINDNNMIWHAYLLQDGTMLYDKTNVAVDNVTLYNEVFKGPYSYTWDKKIFVSKNVRYISAFASDHQSKATEIEFEEGDDLLYIGEEAFIGLDTKSIVFNRPVYIEEQAFAQCNPVEVIFNKDVEYLGKCVFSAYPNHKDGVGRFVFKKVPKKMGNPIVEANDYKEVIVPEGTEQDFISMGILRSRINIAGNKGLSYNIQLQKPNSILSHLPTDKLKYIDSLTIVGFLYETDLAVLQECKNLRYLDLQNAIITYSPEKMEQNRNDREAALSFFQLMGLNADMQYNDFKMSSMDYLFTKAFVKLAEGSIKVTQAEKACFIPDAALANMYHLETVILPARASRIGQNAFSHCTSLKEVKLPPYLERIGHGAFAYCESLENIEFPSTLKSFGVQLRDGSFSHTKVKTLDFSKCNFEPSGYYYHFQSKEYPLLQEIHFPYCKEGIYFKVDNRMKIYTKSSVGDFSCFSENNEIHFITITPPKEGSIYNSTIYIPKGSTTAYFAKFGSSNKYIEE